MKAAGEPRASAGPGQAGPLSDGQGRERRFQPPLAGAEALAALPAAPSSSEQSTDASPRCVFKLNGFFSGAEQAASTVFFSTRLQVCG